MDEDRVHNAAIEAQVRRIGINFLGTTPIEADGTTVVELAKEFLVVYDEANKCIHAEASSRQCQPISGCVRTAV